MTVDPSNTSADSNDSGTLWVVDQIEAGWAILIARDFEGDPLSVPSRLLPENLREGDYVRLVMSAAPQESEQARDQIAAKVAELTQDDDGDDFSL